MRDTHQACFLYNPCNLREWIEEHDFNFTIARTFYKSVDKVILLYSSAKLCWNENPRKRQQRTNLFNAKSSKLCFLRNIQYVRRKRVIQVKWGFIQIQNNFRESFTDKLFLCWLFIVKYVNVLRPKVDFKGRLLLIHFVILKAKGF